MALGWSAFREREKHRQRERRAYQSSARTAYPQTICFAEWFLGNSFFFYHSYLGFREIKKKKKKEEGTRNSARWGSRRASAQSSAAPALTNMKVNRQVMGLDSESTGHGPDHCARSTKWRLTYSGSQLGRQLVGHVGAWRCGVVLSFSK